MSFISRFPADFPYHSFQYTVQQNVTPQHVPTVAVHILVPKSIQDDKTFKLQEVKTNFEIAMDQNQGLTRPIVYLGQFDKTDNEIWIVDCRNIGISALSSQRKEKPERKEIKHLVFI